jgi:hypothetical protein
MPNNSYPELKEIEFRAVSVEMGTIIAALKAVPYSKEVKRAAYVVIRNETGNGKTVICGNNVSGAQGDSGRWPTKWDASIVATCVKRENKRVDGSGGDIRRFLVFSGLQDGISFLCDRLQSKGVFIGSRGGKYHKAPVLTVDDLADAYQDEWVFGQDHVTKKIEADPFISMYRQAEKLFT